MKTRDIDKIIFQDFKRSKIIGFKPEIISIDTETFEGKAFLLCYWTNGHKGWKEINSFNDWASFFLSKIWRGKLFTAWNANYDFRALIKHLPNSKLKELAINDTVEYQGYKIRIFGNKYFRISRGHKSITLYDACQFYSHSSLDEAGKFFLGIGKNEGIDSSKIDYELYKINIK